MCAVCMGPLQYKFCSAAPPESMLSEYSLFFFRFLVTTERSDLLPKLGNTFLEPDIEERDAYKALATSGAL